MTISYGWWLPAEGGSSSGEYRREYFRRELHLTFRYGGNQLDYQLNRIKQGKLAIVATDATDSKIELLQMLPKRSVMLFLTGDETYKFWVMAKIARSERVRILVRDYPLPSMRNCMRIPLVVFFNLFVACRYPKLMKSFFESLVKGILMSIRQISIWTLCKFLRIRVMHLPLGYTDDFAERVAEIFSLGSESHLIDNQDLSVLEFSYRGHRPYFSGQLAQFDRRVIQKVNVDLGNSAINFYVGYMNFGKEKKFALDRYIKNLSKCKFSLCPAGNWSRETFRYFESMLLGAVPITAKYVLSDPIRNPRDVVRLGTWLSLKPKVLEKIEAQLLEQRLKEAKSEWQNKIMFLREIFV